MMIKSISKLSNRILAVVLAVLILAVSLPLTTFMVMANEDKSVITTDINEKEFVIGQPTEFTFTTTANGDAGKMVFGSFEFSDPTAIEKLEYKESKDGNWYQFDGLFGPVGTGFPMSDATSTFRVTFIKAGTFDLTVKMVSAENENEELSRIETKVVVTGGSELSTTIGDEPFYEGVSKEFTFTTVANGHAGKMVFGAFNFSDPTAIEKLEYKESKDGNWYQFDGLFGPAGTGFPMTDATSTFRATFNKPGKYTVSASMILASNQQMVLSDVEADVLVYGTSVLSTDIGNSHFVVDRSKEFTFTTVANNDKDKMVLGSFSFSDPDAIEKLEYKESKDGQWYEFNGDFGPATGFPMADATSTFRATFNKAGKYTVDAYMKTLDGTVLSTTKADVVVEEQSVVTTDIEEKTIIYNQSAEFTVTTKANGDKDTMVFGIFDFSAPEAIEKLEYKESKDGKWYEFNGPFGPAGTGFPMTDATSTFRVTFNRTGEFDLSIAMVTADGRDELCTTSAKVNVKNAKIDMNGITVSIVDKNEDDIPDEFVFTEEKLYDIKELLAVSGLKEGDKVLYSTTGEEGTFASADEFELVDKENFSATPAGTYNIFVKLQRKYHDDENVPPMPITVEIKKADIKESDITITDVYTGIYDKTAHNIVANVESKNVSDSFTYAKQGENEFKREIPTATNVADSGKYIIRVTRNANYNTLDLEVEVKIEKAKIKIYFGTVENVTYKEDNNFKNAIEKIVGIDGNGDEFEVGDEIVAEDIVYSSESENVVEVKADGTVVYDAVGEITVKAEITKEFDNYVAKGEGFATEATYAMEVVYVDVPAWSITDFGYKSDIKWYNTDVVIAPEDAAVWSVIQGVNSLGQDNWAAEIVKTEEQIYNNVKIAFKNNATGEITDLVSVDAFGIDKSAPVISKNKIIFEQKNDSSFAAVMNRMTFGIFFNKNLKITVNAEDLLPDGQKASDIKEYTLTFFDTEGNEVYSAKQEEAIFSVDNEKLENFKGTVKVTIKDNLDNSETYTVDVDNSDLGKHNEFVIENDAPVISITTDDSVIYKDAFNYEFTVNDDVADKNYSGIAAVEVSANGLVVFTEKYPTDKNITSYDYKIAVDPAKQLINNVAVDDWNYGNIVFKTTAYDRAGNVSEIDVTEIKFDNKVPEITKVVFEQKNDNPFEMVMNTLSFGIFYNKNLVVTVNAEDVKDFLNNTSGIKDYKLTFYDEDGEVAYETEPQKENVFNIDCAELENFKGTVTVTLTDNAVDENGEGNTVTYDVVTDNSNLEDLDALGAIILENTAAKITVNTEEGSIHKDVFNFEFNVDDTDEAYYSGLAGVQVFANDTLVYTDALAADDEVYDKDYSLEIDPVAVTVEGVEINIENKGEINFKIVAYDRAGNVSEATEATVYMDNRAPEISADKVLFEQKNDGAFATALNKLTFGLFFNKKLVVTVNAEDNIDQYNAAAGVNEYKLIFVDANGDPVLETDFQKENVFNIDYAELDNFKGTLKVTINDIVGNVETYDITTENSDLGASENAPSFMLENDAPAIRFDNAKDTIYKEGFNFKFNISDETTKNYSGLSAVKVLVNGTEVYVEQINRNTNVSSKNYDFEVKSVAVDGKTVVTVNGVEVPNANGENNGEFLFEVKVYDNAGNAATADTLLYLDNTAPEITEFKFADKTSGDKGTLMDTVEIAPYGFFFKDQVNVTITAEDFVDETNENKASGVASITVYAYDVDRDVYYTVEEIDGEYQLVEMDEFDIEKVSTIATNKSISFDVFANFKGQIYAYATDVLGNNPTDCYYYHGNAAEDGFVKPDGSVIEEINKHLDTSDITITAPEKVDTQNYAYSYEYKGNSEALDLNKDYKDSQLVPLYNGDVKFNVAVEDTYSGIASVKWSVFEGEGVTEPKFEKTVTVDDKSENLSGDVENWKVEDFNEDDKLVYAMSADITVDGNHNDMVILVELTDRAGNTSYDYYVFGIDTTKPVIEVKYNDDVAVNDEQYTDYFRTDRTATITITERNFRAEDVVFSITNTDKVIPNIDLTKSNVWKENVDKEDLDKTTYTAVINYTADGDYTFDISYTDNAENKNDGVDYGKSIAPTKFTIDKTLPTFSVAYDNVNAQNGNYYKALRVATLTIVEHNFDANRVKVLGTATDNGAPIEFPATSTWSGSGDVHTATIIYSADAKYVFDIEFNDMAGNSIADFVAEEFYVDKTNPTVAITGIVDKSANNTDGNIGFKMDVTDTNFNGFTPVLTAVVFNNGNFETKNITVGRTENIANGQRYTVTNLTDDGIYSITCTVVDKAGNAFSEVILEDSNKKPYVEKRAGKDKLITFSVNRNGSTFSLDEFTSDLVKTYYVKEVTKNPTVIEINADPILESKVTLNGKELVENTDYSVKLENSEGSWYKYSYVINKDLFKGEGEYNIVVSSKDKAKNEAFSDIKNVTVKFVVDKTAPTVTVAGIKKNGRYKVEKQTVTLVPADDGGALKSISVRLIDKNGKLKKEILKLTGDELDQALAAGSITFELEQGPYQNVQIICEDFAGNTYGYGEHEIYSNVTVTTSGFMMFWAFKPLRWSVIGGLALIIAGVVAFIIVKRRKKNEE